MELVNYLRILRRRWRLVFVFTLLGMLIGAGTIVFRGSKAPGSNLTFYLAKHTLSSADGTANLSRDAALATEGEVPKRAAAKLGLVSGTSIKEAVRTEARTDVGLLYVAAVSTDPQRAVQIADTFAEELVVYLREFGDQQKQKVLASYDKEITDLTNEYQQAKADITAAPDPDAKRLAEARARDLGNRLDDQKRQRAAANAKTANSENLTTLSTAEAVPISQSSYEKLISGAASSTSKGGGKDDSSSVSGIQESQIDAAIASSPGLGTPARALLGGLAGLLLGAGVVIVADRIDPRIRTKFEAEEAFGWPVIGEIPPLTRRERHERRILSYDEPRSRAAEAFRVLRSALLFASTGGDDSAREEGTHPIFANTTDPSAPTDGEQSGDTTPTASTALADDAGGSAGGSDGSARGRVIMVSSPGPSEGKTTSAANLAAILAETGRSILVINCDFRRPRIHAYLGAEDVPRQVLDTKVPGVKLVSQVIENPHDANPADVVRAQRQIIRNAREMFDIVLLDTAPLLTTNDATEVLPVSDQVLVICKTGKTHKEAADRAAELLERRNAPVVGVVVVAATDVPTARYYYYGGDVQTYEEPEPGSEDLSPLEALLHPGRVFADSGVRDAPDSDEPGPDGGTAAESPHADDDADPHADAATRSGTAGPRADTSVALATTRTVRTGTAAAQTDTAPEQATEDAERTATAPEPAEERGRRRIGRRARRHERDRDAGTGTDRVLDGDPLALLADDPSAAAPPDGSDPADPTEPG